MRFTTPIRVLREQVAATPEAVALCQPDIRGATTYTELTYRELDRRATLLAQRLREQGVGAGDFVGLYMQRSLEAIVAMLGAFYLVWGSISHILSGVFGVANKRREDWWNGLAILTIVVLIYGQGTVAVKSVVFFVSLIWNAILGVVTLAL